MNQEEIAQRMRLGLVTADQASDHDDEEWQDMESEEEEVEVQPEPERYTFAQGRRSSINLQQMNENLHDATVDWEAGAGSVRALFSPDNRSSNGMNLRPSGSSKDLAGLIPEVVKEMDDDEDSTVDGDDIEDKDMEK
jgi:hypothetical protein